LYLYPRLINPHTLGEQALGRARCGYIVRNADRGDLDQVFLVELESFDSPYPRWYFDILYELSNSGEYFLVSVDERGRIDGYVVAIPRKGGVCHIVSIAVRRDCRRHYVGSILLQSLFELCDETRPRLYILEVDIRNMGAQALYSKHGFGYAGLIPNYYGDGRHALIMIRTPLWKC